MKVKTALKTTAVMLVLASSLMLFAGCGKKIYSDPNMTSLTTGTLSDGEILYATLSETISKYDASLNDYMHEHLSECKVKKVQDTTLGGVSCNSTFTVSPDNKYRILQQEKKYDDKTVMDEYFDLGSALFVARTTVYNDGRYDPVEKYYIADNMVYKLDFGTSNVYKVVALGTDEAAAKQKQLDMYFTFNEILAKYGS